jgi:hypothetical protein
MWTLSDDQKSVRMHIPPFRLAGGPKPLSIHLDFDAQMVDQILQRLTVLRSKMLPAPRLN